AIMATAIGQRRLGMPRMAATATSYHAGHATVGLGWITWTPRGRARRAASPARRGPRDAASLSAVAERSLPGWRRGGRSPIADWPPAPSGTRGARAHALDLRGSPSRPRLRPNPSSPAALALRCALRFA